MLKRKLVLALLGLSALPLLAQSTIPNSTGVKATVAIRNATIVPVSSAPVPNGTIVIADGVIAAVGRDVAVPADAKVIDGTGLFVYPGMMDAGSTIGLVEVDSVAGTVDTTELGEFNPNAAAIVAVNPHSEVIPVTRVNGVTHALTVPNGGVVSGQSAVIQLAGWTPEEMSLKAPAAMHIRFPRLRSRPLVDSPEDEAEKERKKSYTRAIDELRDLFRNAQAYAKASAARSSDRNVRRFDRDLALEALVPVVEGRVPVVMHAQLERDIRAALAFADEFKLKVILAGAQDVARVVSDLKSRNIPVILGPTLDLPQREDDPYDLLFTNAKVLHDNGVLFAFQTTDAHNSRNLPYNAAAAAAFGLPKEEALRAVTLNPARIFGIEDRLGSLEPGKSANVIVTDGDPLEIRTNVLRVFIAGEEMPMDSRHTLLYEKFRKRPE